MKYRICKYKDAIRDGYCVQGKPWWCFLGGWLFARTTDDNKIAVYRTLKDARFALKKLKTKPKITPIKKENQ